MRHPSEGTLRRLVDEPDGVTVTDREHVTGLHACLASLAAVRDRASRRPAPSTSGTGSTSRAAGHRLAHAVAIDGRRRARPPGPAPRWRSTLRSPAVAAVGVLALVAAPEPPRQATGWSSSAPSRSPRSP